jgi:hypothetical protein
MLYCLDEYRPGEKGSTAAMFRKQALLARSKSRFEETVNLIAGNDRTAPNAAFDFATRQHAAVVLSGKRVNSRDRAMRQISRPLVGRGTTNSIITRNSPGAPITLVRFSHLDPKASDS